MRRANRIVTSLRSKSGNSSGPRKQSSIFVPSYVDLIEVPFLLQTLWIIPSPKGKVGVESRIRDRTNGPQPAGPGFIGLIGSGLSLLRERFGRGFRSKRGAGYDIYGIMPAQKNPAERRMRPRIGGVRLKSNS